MSQSDEGMDEWRKVTRTLAHPVMSKMVDQDYDTHRGVREWNTRWGPLWYKRTAKNRIVRTVTR